MDDPKVIIVPLNNSLYSRVFAVCVLNAIPKGMCVHSAALVAAWYGIQFSFDQRICVCRPRWIIPATLNTRTDIKLKWIVSCFSSKMTREIFHFIRLSGVRRARGNKNQDTVCSMCTKQPALSPHFINKKNVRKARRCATASVDEGHHATATHSLWYPGASRIISEHAKNAIPTQKLTSSQCVCVWKAYSQCYFYTLRTGRGTDSSGFTFNWEIVSRIRIFAKCQMKIVN